MQEVTLALAVLIGAGFMMAKLGQFVRLPSVTGYICAGLLLGPSGLNLVKVEDLGPKLEHFTQIALMLIAFGIGEHLELKRLRQIMKSVGLIGLFETSGAFLLVSLGTFMVARMTNLGEAGWVMKDYLVLAILLGAVSVATAPAATLHVMRELKAAGPFTSTLMAVVAVDDGLAIMIFGIAVTAAHHIVGGGTETILNAIAGSFAEITCSLLMGVMAGLLIDFVVHRLKDRGEMLTAGLMILLLCGEGTRLLNFSPLLAGMAAGFTIVNQDRRDVRVFRTINSFEPPIYVLFFTLAGAHLHVSALAAAGWIGLVYFLLRSLGKFFGARIGAVLAKAPLHVRRYLGLALVPQAGVAIGLIFLIKGDASINEYSSVIIPVVLAAVVLSELSGPVCARFAVEKAGETACEPVITRWSKSTLRKHFSDKNGDKRLQMAPWAWEPLKPAPIPNGAVIFGVSRLENVAGLARIATLMAHYHRARPLAVRVAIPTPSESGSDQHQMILRLLEMAQTEVRELGYEMNLEIVHARDIASGILEAARKEMAYGIVLGHPLKHTAQEFQRVVEAVASKAPCQVIVVRFAEILHTERILIPVTEPWEFDVIRSVLCSFSEVGRHKITILRLMSSDSPEEALDEAEEEMLGWTEIANIATQVECHAAASESHLETILHEAGDHDLIVMAVPQPGRLQRIFFGSLCGDVAQCCNKTMLMVYHSGG